MILDVLTSIISRLAGLALHALGLRGTRLPDTVSVSAVWTLEVWWELRLPQTIHDSQIGPEAAATLRTALGQLADDLELVVADGGGAAEVRAQIIRFRDRWTGWARRVAITESTRMASEAVLTSPAALRPGAMKEWQTSHDERVRGTHRLADGDRAALSGVFTIGDGSLRYPGDPYGPPEEVVGCRCAIKIVTRGTP